MKQVITDNESTLEKTVLHTEDNSYDLEVASVDSDCERGNAR